VSLVPKGPFLSVLPHPPTPSEDRLPSCQFSAERYRPAPPPERIVFPRTRTANRLRSAPPPHSLLLHTANDAHRPSSGLAASLQPPPPPLPKVAPRGRPFRIPLPYPPFLYPYPLSRVRLPESHSPHPTAPRSPPPRSLLGPGPYFFTLQWCYFLVCTALHFFPKVCLFLHSSHRIPPRPSSFISRLVCGGRAPAPHTCHHASRCVTR
jgi:hypothetical protein